MKITDFLIARLDEKEALAKEESDPDWCPDYLHSAIRHVQRNCDIDCYAHDDPAGWSNCGQPDRYAGTFIADNDPKYVLADIAAKRKIIKMSTAWPSYGMRATLVYLAAPFSDHPDFQPEWAA